MYIYEKRLAHRRHCITPARREIFSTTDDVVAAAARHTVKRDEPGSLVYTYIYIRRSREKEKSCILIALQQTWTESSSRNSSSPAIYIYVCSAPLFFCPSYSEDEIVRIAARGFQIKKKPLEHISIRDIAHCGKKNHALLLYV